MAGKTWAVILLGLWLILYGLLAVTNFSFSLAPVVMGILAIVDGICWWFGK